jgi:hypothetical protein
VHLDEVINPLLDVVNDAKPHCVKEVLVREVAHYTRNMLKHIESSVNMVQHLFSID